MKKSVTVSVNEKKLSAIEMYLEQKNTTLAAELEKYADQLYGKDDYDELYEMAEKACEKAEDHCFCQNGKAVRAVIRHGSHCVPSCGVFRAWVG